MRALVVVIVLPAFQNFPRICQRAKQVFVQAFVSEFAIEALDKTILLGLAGGDVAPINTRNGGAPCRIGPL